MIPEAVPLSSAIEAKIVWARACNDRYAESLLKDVTVSAQIDSLNAATAASREEMTRSGVGEICRVCETEEGGSCCGAGLENRYDGWLLLTNALLGVTLPAVRWRNNACFFLGAAGCRLKARHVICINYLCKKITDAIPPSGLEQLRQSEGEETNTLFSIIEQLKRMLRK